MADDRWEKIRAAFEAGSTLAELSARYKTSAAEILRRATKEKWMRAAQRKLLQAPVVKEGTLEHKLDEAAQDIIRDHRDKTRQHRKTYEALYAEFQGLIPYMVSLLDEEQRVELDRQTPEKRVEFLLNVLKAFGTKLGYFGKLGDLLRNIIDIERVVWGLDKTDDAPESVQWEDLLAKVREAPRARPLPENVVNFERKLLEHRKPE